ncbi:putative fatty acid desaturase [Macrophomina phaseolina]|uniref:Fatty acid desaturase n=1 Tax=Macrophomina phaseolina TaxID=35725 RepID=A0ABQ8G1I5_9PEZI|nr:putative fatty acid desaturase [Macrophomina phaseolina]
MGWMKLKASSTSNTQLTPAEHDLKYAHSPDQHYPHIEHLPLADEALPNEELPFLSAVDFAAQLEENVERLYLVIDSIVYDCTDYAHDHPGGARILFNFKGTDCSWQFWRFHSAEHLRAAGHRYRIARTTGVANRFQEKPRYVGLARLGSSQDW